MTLIRCLLAALGLAAAAGAQAQLRLPQLPHLPSLPAVAEPLARGVSGLAPVELLGEHRRRIEELLAAEPRHLERDPQGQPIVRGELLLVSPPVAVLDAAQAAGFRPLRTEALPGGVGLLVVLQPPAGMGTADALARLRAMDPALDGDFNHVLLPAGELGEARRPGAPPAAAPAAAARVGLIDGGVDASHPALRGATVQRFGCDGRAVPDAHGTGVASLLVGRADRFAGSAPGARLYAADIYCGAAANGSMDAVLRALGWMAEQQVPVINLSIVGPPNRLLERALGALSARGHLIVAAVGNDGPAAPPLYPAAYAGRLPGVVGVSAVDARSRVLPEAAQGPQVVLCAPGADMAVAASGERGYVVARGTSFAAPLVAGLLAAALPAPQPEQAARALAALAREAQDLGAPGRDPVYGFGLVAQSLRVEPSQVRAAR